MSGTVSRLLDVLAVEEQIHRDLRIVLADERDRMLALDAESLYELARQKEILAEQGRLAQDARLETCRTLAQELNLSREDLTLTKICEAMGDLGGPLREAQSRLLSIVGAVVELSEANRRLGGERLGDVQATLDLLGRLAPQATRESATQPGHLVRRSA